MYANEGIRDLLYRYVSTNGRNDSSFFVLSSRTFAVQFHLLYRHHVTCFFGYITTAARCFDLHEQALFDFIQSFCGKDEADLLAIQSIRSVDSFLSVEDVYSIFSLDSEDLDAIQKRCGFRNRNGLCTVRSGIKSSLDYVHDLLKKKQTEAARVKKSSATLRTSTDVPSPIDVSLPSNDDSSITIRPGKTEAEHRENINKCIEEWCLQNTSDFGVDNFDFASDLTYELRISSSLVKGEIKCSCGLSASLFLGESGNFKVRW